MQEEGGLDVLKVVENELVLGHAESPIENVGRRLRHQVFLLVLRIRHIDGDQFVMWRFQIGFEGEDRA